MANMLSILILEDQPYDADLLVHELHRAGFEFEWQCVDNEKDYCAALESPLDIILADYNLPQFDAPQALKLLQKRGLDIPFILVTGSVGEESVVEIMRQGAADYLLKDRLARLGQAVQRALEEKRIRHEKRLAEGALRESEARFRSLFESAPIGISISRDLIRLYANPALVRMLEYKDAAELVGVSILDQTAPEYLARVRAMMAKMRARTSSLEFETFLRRSDGFTFPVQVQMGHITLSDGPAIVSFLTDITERYEAQQALSESEMRFRLLFENSPIGVTITRNRIRLYANRAFADMFGYNNPEDLIGKRFIDQVAPEYRDQVIAVTDSAAQTLPISFDTVAQRKDGSVFPVNVEMGLISLPDGPASVHFTTDLTHRKLLEEEKLRAEALRLELEKEKELLELKDRFTSMVSHEFRTPLTVIRMSSELMANFPQRFSEERKLKFLNEIQSQVKYMVQLLEDILIIGKAKANKLEFTPTLVDVGAFCQGIFEELQLTDDGKHEFIFSNEGDVHWAYLDERLVRHILVNLLSNAAKYSPSGGQVRLELSSENTEFIFRISDQGIGIPKEDHDRLFEAFHRAKNVKNIQGTGLGLAIVKNHVEMHGGNITFESEPGVGTTFTVRLPAHSNVDRSS